MRRNSYIEALQEQPNHPLRQEAERLAHNFETDTYKDSNYVIRWKSNNSVPPQEVLDFWKYIGKRFNMTKSVAARERETKQFIEEYKRNQKPPTDEELYEMKAAFGEGATIVDIITGKKIKL